MSSSDISSNPCRDFESDDIPTLTTEFPQIFCSEPLSLQKLYISYFSELPNTISISDVDQETSLLWFRSYYSDLILKSTSRYSVGTKTGKLYEDAALLVLKHKMIVDMAYGNWHLLFPPSQLVLATGMSQVLRTFLRPEKKKPFEMNLIINEGSSLELKSVTVHKTKLNLDLFYNDDFPAIDAIIRKELAAKNTKGLILLHGAPGTGKTTYLRHLIGKLKKPVLYLSPSMAEHLMDPGFIDLLIDNPNCVLIIEEAELIVKSRRGGSNPSISNLLNIADGLLSDCLNIQIICTFNQPISDIDAALMRKGRLIARSEFFPLKSEKAQRLSDHLGRNIRVSGPMTIAEIAGKGPNFSIKTESIGFRGGMNRNVSQVD